MVLFLDNDKDSSNVRVMSDMPSAKVVDSVELAMDEDLLRTATVFVIASSVSNPVKAIQRVYAADQQLSVIVLAEPAQVRQIKQAILFAPYIGKNTLVVTVNPELNWADVCRSAALRTVQKRNFSKLNLSEKTLIARTEKIKLSHIGTFLEFAPIAALILSETDIIVNGNRQAKRLLPSLEFLGEDLRKYFPPPMAESVRRFIHSSHNQETTIDVEWQGKVFELSATEVHTEETERHFLLLMSDVTNQRKETLRVQSILEALPQMAWTADPDGLVTYFNGGWYFYTGQTEPEALNTGWVTVVHRDDSGKLTDQWKASLASGKPLQHAARYRNLNGEYRWHLVRGSAVRNPAGAITLWVGTCTDIHDQIQLTEELERKVKERTHLLEATNSELEQFAHVSSHDLQEPLRKIKIFSELLKGRIYDSVDETSKKHLDKISATAERMSGSLRALLDYTHLQREEKFVPVDLNDIVSQVLIDLELMIAQKNADIKLGHLPTVTGIPIQLQQLFYNLINNALKFSKKETTPLIEISSRQLMEEELTNFPQLRRFRKYCEITVKDNGIGFEQKYAEKIFTIFQRLHSKSEFDGTGIGLSLAKKVVTNHGGEIIAKSTVEIGTSFHVILAT
jgi:PAS domain S-box-containing protein